MDLGDESIKLEMLAGKISTVQDMCAAETEKTVSAAELACLLRQRSSLELGQWKR